MGGAIRGRTKLLSNRRRRDSRTNKETKEKKMKTFIKAINRSLVLALFALTIPVAATIAQPANDNFENAELISGMRVVVAGTNVGATKEAGEPDHAGNPGGRSVWFRWTAPRSGAMLFGTNRTGGNFNSLLQVYVGTDVTALANRGSNNDINPPINLKSVIRTGVEEGTTYSIVVDGAVVGGDPAAEGTFTLDIRPIFPYQSSDYDGDGNADLSVFRPSDNTWYIKGSTKNIFRTWGTAGDVPVTMSRINGRSEPAVFRPSTGVWYYFNIFPAILKWGVDGDIPVPESYGSEVSSAFAVFRPSNSTWYIYYTDQNTMAYKFGLPGDIPVPGRYSADSAADLAVFRPSTGVWHILRRQDSNPSHDSYMAIQFGQPGDQPVPGDYDGDGTLDPAIFRPTTGTWWVLRSSDQQAHAFQWGTSSDIPVTGDFDEDGIFDFAVFRPSEGNWYIRHGESGSIRIEHWGTQGDIPMTANRHF
jgi:hypothetical protein